MASSVVEQVVDTAPTRGSTRGRAAALAVLGLVLASVGIGLFPHVLRGGELVAAAVAVVGVVGGLVLLVGAGLVLVRSLRGWRKLWAVPVAYVAVQFVALPLAVAVMVTHVARPDLGERTPADVGLAAEAVTFDASDGVRLAGWYVPSRTGAAVVLRHGASSTRTAVLDHAAVLARHGYGVLLTDARGNGESAGRGMAFGWWGERDVTGAVSFLAARPDVDPGRIGVVGLSMGGEEAIGAAASDARIRAVVAEGATARVAADHGWEGNPFARVVQWLTTTETDLLTPAPRPRSLHDAVAAAAPTPFLLVTASKVGEEGDAAAWIRSASPGTVQVWEVEGAGHTGGLRTDAGGWERTVVGFLDEALAAP